MKHSLWTLLLMIMLLLLIACGKTNEQYYNIEDYGAKAVEGHDNTAAIQQAIDECASHGGGQVIIPAGNTYECGPLQLQGNIDLHLMPGSRLKALPDESLYTSSAFGDNRGEGMMWISALQASNISITGTGTLDGNGVAFMGAELDDSYELKPVTDFDPRPHVLTMVDCHNIKISDITITGSAYWTVHLVGCTDVAISDISLLNNLKIRNGDGIDLDHSRKVRITGCYIESGDDCICLKNRREYDQYGPCRDITVTNCIMTSRSCAVKIGSENVDSIDHVLFDNCIIRNSNRGIGIQNRDEGTVTDVTFANMSVECLLHSEVWWGQAEPIYVTSYPRACGNHKDAGWRFPKGATQGACGEVSDIRFINITATAENGCFIGGDAPGKINNLLFDNISIQLKRMTSFTAGCYDRRPCLGEGIISPGVYGFYVDCAQNITFKNCSVTNTGNELPYMGAFYAINDQNVKIEP